MTVPTLQKCLAAADLFALLLLAAPAFRLDRLGKLMHDMGAQMKTERVDPFWKDYFAALLLKLARQRDAWTLGDRVCLWSGYSVLLIVSVIKLVTAA